MQRSHDLFERLRAALADRYDVQDEVGQGGMATVFLAMERHPERRVAIKVLLPELSGAIPRERFLREVNLASKLTHPHIVPVFAAGEADGLLYYVMPFVDGESLRQRIERDRPMTLDAAVPIVREVASALEYAHALGIVHRDIKPENILLAGGHAMVADFGIARALGAAERDQLTRTGRAIGTPRYMSPEQWSASTELDGRSDVYSLGCVLWEMIGGDVDVSPVERVEYLAGLAQRPGTGATPEVRLAGVLVRALALRPGDRFESAGAFGQSMTTPESMSADVPAPRRRRGAAWVAALALVAIAVAVWPGRRDSVEPGRVAVAVFENQTGDPAHDPIGTLAADWITQGLARTGVVEVVGMRANLAAGTSPRGPGLRRLGPIQALARETGAGIVITGTYYLIGDEIQFQTRITDAREDRLIRGLDPVSAPVDAPLEAIEVLRQRVMGSLAALMDDRLSSWASLAAQPPSFEAYQHYVEGMTQFMSLNQVEGIERMLQAAALDSTFVAPVLFAAHAFATLGEWAVADSLAQEVAKSRASLAPLDLRLLEWIEGMIDGDLEAALEATRETVAIAPGSEGLILQGMTALFTNRPHEAIDALTQLDPESGFVAVFFLYWDFLASSYAALGMHEEELDVAIRGRTQHPDKASVLEKQAHALSALGRLDEADGVLRDLERLPPQPGSMWIIGDMLRTAGLDLRVHGHDSAAAAVLDRASAWYEALPAATLDQEPYKYGLARVRYEQGRLDEAESLFRELRRMVPDSVGYHGYLAGILAKRGESEAAERAAAALSGFETPYSFGVVEFWQARVAALLGQREAAVRLLHEAYRKGKVYDLATHLIGDLQSLAGFEPYLAFLAPRD